MKAAALLTLLCLTPLTVQAVSGDMTKLINRVAQEQGIDARILTALIKIESDFRIDAQSAKGALGLLQLMPITQKEMGISKPFDAAANLRAGSGYFVKQYDRFAGNIDQALWAYNAGAQRVEKGIMPSETVQYIERFYVYLHALIIAQQQLKQDKNHD